MRGLPSLSTHQVLCAKTKNEEGKLGFHCPIGKVDPDAAQRPKNNEL
jgi:hypothetical protein